MKQAFNPELCKGCGLCERVCPNNAINILRDGKSFILVENGDCSECGLCSVFCFYGALSIDDNAFSEIIREEFELNNLSKVVVDDNCTLCGLCMSACPNNAIKVKREIDLRKLRGGTINIFVERCIECRLCVVYCPTKAIKVGGRPEIDESKCVYCEICSKICPKDALEVECNSCRIRTSRKDFVRGEVVVEESMCSQCGICAEVCPENAISVVKILKGVHKVDLDKCFGVDCQICREVCPNLAVEYRYLPEKEVVFNSRCNFCGACEVFCPANAIEIERDMIDVLNELPIPLDVRDRRKLRGERVTKEIVIDESCFGCGLCSSICSLIKEGRTFQIVDGRGEVISTEMCTMCGVCAENCPVSAISLKEIG